MHYCGKVYLVDQGLLENIPGESDVDKLEDKLYDEYLLNLIYTVAISILTPREYDIFIMYFKDGANIKDIASQLAIVPSTVRSTLWRVRKKLKAVVIPLVKS